MASYINLTTDMKVFGKLVNGKEGPAIRKFYRDSKQLVADKGLERVKLLAIDKPHHASHAFSRSIQVHDFKKGRTIQATYPEILYGPWLEGTSEKNQTTHFKGYSLFRLTRNWLRRQITPILQQRFTKLIDELGGGS